MIRLLRNVLSLTSPPPAPPSRYFSRISTSPPSYPTPHPKDTPVMVLWDIENCGVPKTLKPQMVQAIQEALTSVGIRGGPVQITGFGDLTQLKRTNYYLSSSIKLLDIPPGGKGKGSADSALKSELMCWVLNNPPPAHIFVISGDRDFATILHRLRLWNYNILIATREQFDVHVILNSAATICWKWYELIRREKLTARHFNQPPDDLWYGHYEWPLEDPFESFELKECSWDAGQEIKHKEPNLSQDDWTIVREFLNSELGIVLIARSRTRGEMGRFLLKYGPREVKSLRENDVLLMINILIEREKLVQESPRPMPLYPFKITSSAGITSSAD